MLKNSWYASGGESTHEVSGEEPAGHRFSGSASTTTTTPGRVLTGTTGETSIDVTTGSESIDSAKEARA